MNIKASFTVYLFLFVIIQLSGLWVLTQGVDTTNTKVNGSTFTCSCNTANASASCELVSPANGEKRLVFYLPEMFENLHNSTPKLRNISIVLNDRNLTGFEVQKLNVSKLELFRDTLNVFSFTHKDQRPLAQWEVVGFDQLSRSLLKNITVFVLNMNLAFGSNLTFVKHMKNLKTLDLSNNINLGLNYIFKRNGPLSDICSFKHLENLYLNMVQYPNANGFDPVFLFSSMNCTHADNKVHPLHLRRF